MNKTHPINPPPQLRRLWTQQAQRISPRDPMEWIQDALEKAAQWGADQEFEACCQLIDGTHSDPAVTGDRGLIDKTILIRMLRTARRPKPPSTIEIAEEMMARHNDGWTPSPGDWVIIRDALADGRRAQEALSND